MGVMPVPAANKIKLSESERREGEKEPSKSPIKMESPKI